MAREEKADWIDHLPMVLLGVRTVWRAELDATPAELTFGTSLHLPGEFVEPSGASFTDHDFLKNLQDQMNKLEPVQTTSHATLSQERVPDSLSSATHVFVRRNARAPPLMRPYVGPFKVNRTPKYFEIEMNGKRDCVSINRLKTAFIAQKKAAPTRDPAVICYGPNSNLNSKQRDERAEIVSENSERQPTQPLVKRRGRPSRAVLAERRHEEGARERDRERERQEIAKETRYGRKSRPPDRL